MTNALHDLADLLHKFGDDLKVAADKFEGVLKKDAPTAEAITKKAAKKGVKAAAEEVVQDAAKGNI